MSLGKRTIESEGRSEFLIHAATKISAPAGMAGPIVLVLTDLICDFFNPQYNPLTQSISDHVFGPLGWLQTVSFYLFGVFEIPFALGFYRYKHIRRGFGTGIALLVMIGIGFLILGALHTVPPGHRTTLEGLIHIDVAEIVDLLFPFACFFLAPSLKQDAQGKTFSFYTIAAGIISLILTFERMRPLRDWVWLGLRERALLLNAMIWMELAAIRLLKLQRKGNPVSVSP